MPTLELVCKRLFTTPGWFLKGLLGGVLMLVPIAHFFAFGYFYHLIDRARRGDAVTLPEWGEWRRLFADGLPAFFIFVILGLAPIAVAFLISWPLKFLGYGVIVYLPMVPAVMLAGPLSAAGIYQYQKREEWQDAFRLGVLARMLRASKARFWLPTLALIGLLTVGYPLMTFTVFIGLAAAWTYYASYFRFVEESRKAGLKV
jgi:hypothetical protein